MSPRPFRPRAGVSLTEVLVAAVLLAIGIAGTLSALSTSARFRALALTRESLAAAAMGRLAWLESEGCASADTTISSPPGTRPVELWTVTRAPGVVSLRGSASVRQAGRTQRLVVDTRRACE